MKRSSILTGLCLFFGLQNVNAAVKVGSPAPAFSVADASGKTHTLEAYKGKWVVLEWYNRDCPFVEKHYGAKNMQKLQADATAKGVVWLSVISSKEGKQGYFTPAEAKDDVAKSGSKATGLLLDPTGVMGKAYGAKVTPHMFVINPDGQLVYAGAIDDNDSSDADVIPKSKNYVVAALDEAMAGKPVTVSSTKPYGCGVKY